MDKQAIFFCDLIKNVIHGNEQRQLDENVNWTYLVQLAKEHNLLPIFMEGAAKYPSYIARPEYIAEMSETLAAVAAQVKRTEAFLKLYEAFVQADIHPIVMKGLICRELYGNLCDHRPSGDEDILIRPEEYWKAKEVLTANGYISTIESENVARLDQVQEVTFIHMENKLHIELHLNPFGTENSIRTKMNEYFRGVFDNYREVIINGVTIRTLSHQDHLLFLIFHAFRHFLGGGFGIRQVLDILLYQQQYGTEIDKQMLCKILLEFRMVEFWIDLNHIGNRYFAFTLSVSDDAKFPEELLKDIFLCGAFGNKTQAQQTAILTTLRTTENYLNNRASNWIVMIWKSIFPSKEYLLGIAPQLLDKPWLLPIEWVKRWGRFLRKSKKSDSNLALESMRISQRRLELLKKYDLA